MNADERGLNWASWQSACIRVGLRLKRFALTNLKLAQPVKIASHCGTGSDNRRPSRRLAASAYHSLGNIRHYVICIALTPNPFTHFHDPNALNA